MRARDIILLRQKIQITPNRHLRRAKLPRQILHIHSVVSLNQLQNGQAAFILVHVVFLFPVRLPDNFHIMIICHFSGKYKDKGSNWLPGTALQK